MASTRLSWSSISTTSSNTSDIGTAAALNQFQPPPPLPLQLRSLEYPTRPSARAARTSYSATNLLGPSKSSTHLTDDTDERGASALPASKSTSNLSHSVMQRSATQPASLTPQSVTNLSQDEAPSIPISFNERTPRGGTRTATLHSERDSHLDLSEEESSLPWAAPKGPAFQRDNSPLNISRPSLPATPSPHPPATRQSALNLQPLIPRASLPGQSSHSPSGRPSSSGIGVLAKGLPLQSKPGPTRSKTMDSQQSTGSSSSIAPMTAPSAPPPKSPYRYAPNAATANFNAAAPSSNQRPSPPLPHFLQPMPPLVSPIEAAGPSTHISAPALSIRPRGPSLSNPSPVRKSSLGGVLGPTTPISPGSNNQADMKRLVSKPTQLASVHNNSPGGVLSAHSSVDSAVSRFGFGDYTHGRGQHGGASPDTPFSGSVSSPSVPGAGKSPNDHVPPAMGRSRGPSLASGAPPMSMLQQAQRSRAMTYTGSTPNNHLDAARNSNLPISRTFGDSQGDVPGVSVEESEDEGDEIPLPMQTLADPSQRQQEQLGLTPASAIILAYQQQQHASSSASLRAPSSHGSASGSVRTSPVPFAPSPIPSTTSSQDVFSTTGTPLPHAPQLQQPTPPTRSRSRSRSRATSLRPEGGRSTVDLSEPVPATTFLAALQPPKPPTQSPVEPRSAVSGGSGRGVRRLSKKLSGKSSPVSPTTKASSDDSPSTVNITGRPVTDFMGGIAHSVPYASDEVIPLASPTTGWIDEEGRWADYPLESEPIHQHVDVYSASSSASASSASRSHLPSMYSSSSNMSTRLSHSIRSDPQQPLQQPSPPPPMLRTPSTPITPSSPHEPQKEPQRSRLRTSMSKSFLRIGSSSSASSSHHQHQPVTAPTTPINPDVQVSPSANNSSSQGMGGSFWKLMKKFSTSTLRKGDLQPAGDADEYIPPVPKLPPGITSQTRAKTMEHARPGKGDDSDEEDFGRVVSRNEFGFGNYGYANSVADTSSVVESKSKASGRTPRASVGRSRSGTVVSSATSASISHFPTPPPPIPVLQHRHKRSVSQSRTVVTTATGVSGVLSSSPSDNSSSRHFWKGTGTIGSPRTSTSSYASYPAKINIEENGEFEGPSFALDDRGNDSSVDDHGPSRSVDQGDGLWITAPRSPALRPTHAAAMRSATSLSLPRGDTTGTPPTSPPLPPTPPSTLGGSTRSSVSAPNKSAMRTASLLPSLPLRGDKPSTQQSPPKQVVTKKKSSSMFQRLGRSVSSDVQPVPSLPGRSQSAGTGGMLKSPTKLDRATQSARNTGVASSSMDIAQIGLEPPRAPPPIPMSPASSQNTFTMTHISPLSHTVFASPPHSPMSPSTPAKSPLSSVSFRSPASPDTPESLATLRGVAPQHPLVLWPTYSMSSSGNDAMDSSASPPMSPLSSRPPMSPTSPTTRWSFDERRESADSKDRQSGDKSRPPSRTPRRASMDSSPVSNRLSLNGNSSSSSASGQAIAFRELKSSSVVKRTEDEKVAMWDRLMERSERAGGTLKATINDPALS
ncbi:hypothetical protein FRB95_007021 [Tulasnella sp. JGI-2019a]|nr:hypothetical protein FRB95_007021 [Tulasnella sp. JGI-2019a]